MSRVLLRLLATAIRATSLVVLASVGTVILMRTAPGYFTDSRETDARYTDEARAALRAQQETEGSTASLVRSLAAGWSRGDLGRSKQYDVPVTELLRPRLAVTAKLLLSGLGCGWLLALTFALAASARKTDKGESLIAGPAAVLLALPVGAMATVCLVANEGGPVVVLATVVGVRDFKFLYRFLRQAWQGPHVLLARAQGLAWPRIALRHMLPYAAVELFAIVMMSIVVALSAIVPVEVVFDVAGVGQLAWSAAMNRDLPVLVAVTMLMAVCVALTSVDVRPMQRAEAVP